MELTMKNIIYLIGAGLLISIGLMILGGIIRLTIGILLTLVPLVLIAGGLYLGIRWWQNQNA